jgi:hypothetical protein
LNNIQTTSTRMDKNIEKTIFNTTDATLIISESVKVITKEMIDPYPEVVTEVIISQGVTEISYHAFSGCTSLTSIEIPEGVTVINDAAFRDCSALKSIIIPVGVTEIGYRAFHCCSGLTEITIPKSVTSIGDCAFYCCTSLTSIEIPKGVTEIRNEAFKGCTSLTSITIPKSVTEIGDGAFRGCTELEYIIVPERFKNQTANFWQDRGVDIDHTAIYGMQDLMQNTDLQIKALKTYSEGVNCPVYKSLTLLNPLSHLPISNLITASSKLANLCLPSFVQSGGAGLVNASKYNWQQLLRPLSSKVVECADALAPWLSLYDIARIQVAKATASRPKELQVDHDGHNTAQRSDDFAKSPRGDTSRNLDKTSLLPNPPELSREA